ncbi:hypothetical protein EZL74_05645 [Flavobacterium silvisoli]|uniref:Uncharacterized protein n=1 Tax=Flavobacterium silvisoli TaxID=2529433 RepID=A0A4Q9Z0U1_9FLAO|nr:outer membrane beta-barrel protein [Flavobacterium silvisoli]TBX69899.1 hypothetical protein EZL74_05645 [Flavobacterium silvisoli]
MKKSILTTLLLASNFIMLAQEGENNTKQLTEVHSTAFAIKTKLGFSQLEIDDYGIINGNSTQIDFAVLSKINKHLDIDYGLGYNEFNTNYFSDNKSNPIKNKYLRIPVNLIYKSQFSNQLIFNTGVGLFGNYLFKSNVSNVTNQKDHYMNMGVSVFSGIVIKVDPKVNFGIMIEGQSECFKGNKQILKQTSLISINFIYLL